MRTRVHSQSVTCPPLDERLNAEGNQWSAPTFVHWHWCSWMNGSNALFVSEHRLDFSQVTLRRICAGSGSATLSGVNWAAHSRFCAPATLLST